MKKFTDKQRSVIAKRMGYDGPMQGFDEFLKSRPELESKYSAVTDEYVKRFSKGGVVKLADGGYIPPPTDVPVQNYPAAPDVGPTMKTALPPDDVSKTTATTTAAPAPTNLDTGRYTTFTDIGGKPVIGAAATVNPALITTNQAQFLTTAGIPAMTANQAGAIGAGVETAGAAPTTTPQTFDASLASPEMLKMLQGQQAVQGGLSSGAIAGAAQGSLSAGSIATAAQGEAYKIDKAPTRTLQDGELVSGSTVDQNRVNDVLSQNQAAQGTVTAEMTVQGQLNNMMAQFDAGNPPPWAAGAMRAATAQMAARGIGASSMAGQAIIQAAMEAATPIAAADAQTFKEMGLTNLSNRQQMALATAQQRAQFLGQEFDQNFQTRVLNAAKIADIANMNFSAEQQVQLENARAVNTMNVANLQAKNAAILANAAASASMDMANLNNRQQAAIVNAQAFLQMDMTNVNNAQQMAMFKAQAMSQSLLSDTAAKNAAKQFNASSIQQAEQFNASMVTQVNQFNAAQKNAMSQFNAGEANAISRFNAEVQNRREEFNSSQRLVIDQANAQWMREISTTNTASINAANYLNAQNLQQMTMAEYNNEVQLYRDQVDYAFKSYESDQARASALTIAQLQATATKDAAKYAQQAALGSAVGGWLSKVDGDTWSSIGKVVGGWAESAAGNFFGDLFDIQF